MGCQRKDELDYWLTEHLRLNGVYWGLTALHLLRHPEVLPRDKTLEFVFACQNSDGGFGAAPGHDSHMLYTVSAVQILATVDGLGDLEKREKGGQERIAKCKPFFLKLTSLIANTHCCSYCRPAKHRDWHICWR
jgi:geranylgeranyl transferase type-2 subunit beta